LDIEEGRLEIYDYNVGGGEGEEGGEEEGIGKLVWSCDGCTVPPEKIVVEGPAGELS